MLFLHLLLFLSYLVFYGPLSLIQRYKKWTNLLPGKFFWLCHCLPWLNNLLTRRSRNYSISVVFSYSCMVTHAQIFHSCHHPTISHYIHLACNGLLVGYVLHTNYKSIQHQLSVHQQYRYYTISLYVSWSCIDRCMDMHAQDDPKCSL